MLKAAQLYESELMKLWQEQWYNEDNMFYYGGPGEFNLCLPDSTSDSHNFVSIDSDDKILGYIAYNVDWTAMSVTQLGIISFDKGNPLFGKDVYRAVYDIFYKYNMNRLDWWCYADNPAIKAYRRFIKKYGGVECGHFRQTTRLRDGKLHDAVNFEILKSEFIGKKA